MTHPLADPTPPLAFEHLLKAYFHQDWDLNGARASEVLDTFLARNPSALVVAARDEGREVLARLKTPEAIETELDARGLDYEPSIDGLDHRQWPELVVDRLSSAEGEGAPVE